MFKKILIALVIFSAGLYFLLNSPRAGEKIIPKIIILFLTDARLSGFTIEGQQFHFLSRMDMQNVRFSVYFEKEQYDVVIRDARLDASDLFGSPEHKIHLDISGIDIRSSEINVENMALQLDISAAYRNIKGVIEAQKAVAREYRLDAVRAKFVAGRQDMELYDFFAEFYGGQLAGQVLMDYTDEFSYIARMKVLDADLGRMREINPDVFSKIEGKIKGDAVIVGNQGQLQSFDAGFDVPRGGMIQANVLADVVTHVPAGTQQREELQQLITRNGFISLDKAVLKIESLSDEKLIVRLNLLSNEFNLAPNYTIEINIEGGLLNLLRQLRKISL